MSFEPPPSPPPGPASSNLLLQEVDYQVEETERGVWRRYLYPGGHLYADFTSHARVLGLPVVHYTRGRSPETGKRVTARGFLAVGRKARGVIAVGQLAAGGIAVGQLAIGPLALGQLGLGVAAVGQGAVGVLFALGQLAAGHVAVGQLAFGTYVLAQLGFGTHVWDVRGVAPAARELFAPYVDTFLQLFR